jgi:hypothetical protein
MQPYRGLPVPPCAGNPDEDDENALDAGNIGAGGCADDDLGCSNGGGDAAIENFFGGRIGCGDSGVNGTGNSAGGAATNGLVERLPEMLYGQKGPVPERMFLTVCVGTILDAASAQFATFPELKIGSPDLFRKRASLGQTLQTLVDSYFLHTNWAQASEGSF